MKLLLKRLAKKDKYTIGDLYIDGKWFSNTLEDTDRGLTQDMSLEEIKKIKVYGKTAIPTGIYRVNMNIISPKFSKYTFYKNVCNGKLPRLMNVPGFDGILIHVGEGKDGHKLTHGCILVGNNTIVGGLTNSRETFKKLYQELKKSKDITITIQ